jgi:beta-lactamase regulating signal transducer with metallopeptidase domain
MNGLGIALATAALQVTLAAAPAAVLVALAGRRSPRTAAALAAAALGLCALLTAAALAPSPGWWSWAYVSGGRPSAASEPTTTAAPAPGGAPAGSWRVTLRRLTDLLPVAAPADGPPPAILSARSLLAGLFLAGVGFEVLRLLAGLRAVVACRRRSRPIADADLLRLADELWSALGGRGSVEVRSSPEVGTAATVGCVQPVILLADDWPDWPADERRAVLAHELAHVRRRDYLAGLLALACRALHFYHPLVRWLAGRLRLHQELVADALAAGATGGRGVYLRALAGMALRQDRFFAAGVARPFLTDRGTLLRRVAMLRVMEDSRPLGQAARWGMGLLLVAAALGASAVRGPAQAPAPADGGVQAMAEDVPPFDLSYVPPSAAGFMAIRPAALLSRPEMRPIAERWNRQFKAECRAAGFGPAFDIPLDAIEQVVGPMELKVYTDEELKKMYTEEQRKKDPQPPRHAVMMGLTLIRMNRDFDWPATLKAAAPLAQVTEVKPGVFECRAPAFGPQTLTIHIPDRRTLVCSFFPGQAVNRDAEAAKRWGPVWKSVEHAGLVEVLDNRDGRWTDSFKDEPDAAPVLAVLGRPAHIAVGLHWGECVAATFAVDYAGAPANTGPGHETEAIRRTLRDELARQSRPAGAADKTLHAVADEMLKSAAIRRDGKLVTAEARSAMKWLDVFQTLTPADDETGKVKVEVREVKP